MRNYDLSVFFDVSKGEEEAKRLQDKLVSVVEKSGGKIYNHENLGKVALAGTFKKHSQAYGARIQYATDNKGLDALNKEYQINEGIIRQLNMRLEHVVDEEKIEELTK
ncbi:MAG: 30S ribosomal protein S6 [Candidatus Margulisiibacteriota bacterium]